MTDGILNISNVQISGSVSCVPKTIISNVKNELFNSSEEALKFVEMTGVKEKRHLEEGVLVSDLCFEAAELLIKKLEWEKDEIGVLIMVTQTPDYLIPNTAIILQDRLGLSKNTACFDIPLGCSGFVYGASVISSMLTSQGFKKGILLVGDSSSLLAYKEDKTSAPLFGDAGCAIAFECKEGKNINFKLWSDGSGFKSIMIPDGGFRNRFSEESLHVIEDADGSKRTKINPKMDGTDVFSFGITQVPREIKSFLQQINKDVSDIDYFLFHQANMFMLEMIRKKVKLESSQVPYSITKYGNTSSASIPLTLSLLGAGARNKKIAMCGFGIGLSIGCGYFETGDVFVNELIEYEG
ncbi:ketoacyl-ACP synthase III [Flavobacterium paronense]|uniref:Ketoacyl-ACP synthase III n=1 Tax=Flavobacterium paronense TaxID=1392775 RepID=A0ABV5GFD5_9FLAO|nr:ketoacyl-ACP synthase III [Flavobacterium paronense]MDN3676037.1 ketoacyl-ACP synthase III [Flavobacterium paronense]